MSVRLIDRCGHSGSIPHWGHQIQVLVLLHTRSHCCQNTSCQLRIDRYATINSRHGKPQSPNIPHHILRLRRSMSPIHQNIRTGHERARVGEKEDRGACNSVSQGQSGNIISLDNLERSKPNPPRNSSGVDNLPSRLPCVHIS